MEADIKLTENSISIYGEELRSDTDTVHISFMGGKLEAGSDFVSLLIRDNASPLSGLKIESGGKILAGRINNIGGSSFYLDGNRFSIFEKIEVCANGVFTLYPPGSGSTNHTSGSGATTSLPEFGGTEDLNEGPPISSPVSEGNFHPELPFEIPASSGSVMLAQPIVDVWQYLNDLNAEINKLKREIKVLKSRLP